MHFYLIILLSLWLDDPFYFSLIYSFEKIFQHAEDRLLVELNGLFLEASWVRYFFNTFNNIIKFSFFKELNLIFFQYAGLLKTLVIPLLQNKKNYEKGGTYK